MLQAESQLLLADQSVCSIGQYPYNILTKYANMALDYQDTPNYECDREIGSCELAPGDTLVAVVTLATA